MSEPLEQARRSGEALDAPRVTRGWGKVSHPRLPHALEAQVEDLLALADETLTKAVQGRRRGIARHTPALVCGRTKKAQCDAALADSELAGRTLLLRLLGERLESIGGVDLMEASVSRLALLGLPHADLRRELVRAAWHQVGEFLA